MIPGYIFQSPLHIWWIIRTAQFVIFSNIYTTMPVYFLWCRNFRDQRHVQLQTQFLVSTLLWSNWTYMKLLWTSMFNRRRYHKIQGVNGKMIFAREWGYFTSAIKWNWIILGCDNLYACTWKCKIHPYLFT